MESFFEKRFNPANVDRFTYDEVDAVKHYTKKRQNTASLLSGLTLVSVVLSVILPVIAIITQSVGIVLAGGIAIIIVAVVFYRFLRVYYWYNFCLKTVHRYQKTRNQPNASSKRMRPMAILHAISISSVMVSLGLALLVPSLSSFPPLPTLIPTPVIMFTPSATDAPPMTHTPSITPSATLTMTPTAIPTQFIVVDSPRAVAVYICPQVSCQILTMLDPEEMVTVVSRDAWIEIQLEDGRRGFIPSFLTSG